MRKIVWFKTADAAGWTCSQCTWKFEPSGELVGNSFEEMQTNFERERDKQFAAHVCAKHQK